MSADESVKDIASEVSTVSQCINSSRFDMFKILMENAVERIASGLSEDDYIKLFGNLSALKKSKSAPVKMHKTMKSNLIKNLNSEINSMIKEEQIEEKFDKLDKLVDECSFYEGKDTWRPNGDVNQHVRSHVMEKKLRHKCELEEYVRDREHATEMLKQQVSALRAQISEAEETLVQLKEQSLDTSVVDRIEKKIVQHGLYDVLS